MVTDARATTVQWCAHLCTCGTSKRTVRLRSCGATTTTLSSARPTVGVLQDDNSEFSESRIGMRTGIGRSIAMSASRPRPYG